MQKRTLILCLLMIGAISLTAQRTISGEGEVVKQEITLEAITGVSLGFHGDIILTQGSSQKITMEGQQNILDNIKREVKNGTWKVTNDKNVRNAKPVKVYITLATLKNVRVSGSGSISGTNAFSGLGDLEVSVSGSGDIDLDITAQDVSTRISGSGEVRLAGTANSLEIHISGSGDVEADGLQVKDCSVVISGSGNADVHPTGMLEATVSGSGDVRYKGSSANVKSRVSGSGHVKKM